MLETNTMENTREFVDEKGLTRFHFRDGLVKSRTFANKDGAVTAVINYLNPAEMSPFLQAKLQKAYPKLKVFGVTEFTTNDGQVYEIIMQDAKCWYKVRCVDGADMFVAKKFRKA